MDEDFAQIDRIAGEIAAGIEAIARRSGGAES
jgi:hypothetical protein